jgi:hypothetical protein
MDHLFVSMDITHIILMNVRRMAITDLTGSMAAYLSAPGHGMDSTEAGASMAAAMTEVSEATAAMTEASEAIVDLAGAVSLDAEVRVAEQ